MIKITKCNSGVYPDREVPNFIDEIKHIRTYTMERYGITCGLKQAKELIEDIMEQQKNNPVFQISQLSKSMTTWQLNDALADIQAELNSRDAYL